MYSTLGGWGGGEVEGERVWLDRRGLERRGGVDGLRGLRSESNRFCFSSGEEGRVGVMERLRLGGRGEEVGLVVGSESHGIVLGGILVLDRKR